MFVLHVEMDVKPGSRQVLEKTYVETFQPAISCQQGFSGVALLRAQDKVNSYLLSLAFASQASQQKWVSTKLHQAVWPQMEQYCEQYSIKCYDAVGHGE